MSFVHPRIDRRTAVQAGMIGLLRLGIEHLAPLRVLAGANSWMIWKSAAC